MINSCTKQPQLRRVELPAKPLWFRGDSESAVGPQMANGGLTQLSRDVGRIDGTVESLVKRVDELAEQLEDNAHERRTQNVITQSKLQQIETALREREAFVRGGWWTLTALLTLAAGIGAFAREVFSLLRG